jgi:hypothetical protein
LGHIGVRLLPDEERADGVLHRQDRLGPPTVVAAARAKADGLEGDGLECGRGEGIAREDLLEPGRTLCRGHLRQQVDGPTQGILAAGAVRAVEKGDLAEEIPRGAEMRLGGVAGLRTRGEVLVIATVVEEGLRVALRAGDFQIGKVRFGSGSRVPSRPNCFVPSAIDASAGVVL